MKWSLFVLIILSVLNIRAQNTSLPERKLIEYLIAKNDFNDTSSSWKRYSNMVYDRILIKNNKIKIYEFGVNSSHAYKHIAVLQNRKIIFFQCIDFEIEINAIKELLGKANLKATKKFNAELLYIYKFNKNANWNNPLSQE